jgi:hypothetical protein
MIDNMPYVLAEASVMRIPLLIYDVGGVTEMIDPKLHSDIICGTPKARPAAWPLRGQRSHIQFSRHSRAWSRTLCGIPTTLAHPFAPANAPCRRMGALAHP